MRRRTLFLVAMLTVLAVGAGCSSPAPGPQVEAAPTPAPSQPPFLTAPATLPTTPPHLDPTRPPPGPPLPVPIAIPVDDYAPETVREIGTMEIPALRLRHRLFQGVTLHNIDRGPSHWTGSALPGQMGNAVFAGHRATHGQPFRNIDALDPGDEVIFTVDGTRSTYEVTGHLVVGPKDSWIANQTPEYTATLYACHPVGSAAERYVVRLRLVQ